jgi:hypothetical protein
MKVSIKKTEVYASMTGGGSAGKPIRQATQSLTPTAWASPPVLTPLVALWLCMCFGSWRPEEVAHHAGCYRIQKEVLLMANEYRLSTDGQYHGGFCCHG